MQQKNYLKIVDNSYRLKRSAGYHLNVHLASNRFSYTVFNPAKQMYIALFDAGIQNNILNVEACLQEDDLLQQSFSKICVAFSGPDHLLVPKKLYSQKSEEKLTEKIFSSQPDLSVNNFIKPLNAHLISGIDNNLQSIVNQHLTGSSLIHEGVVFIYGLLNDFAKRKGSILCLNIHDDYMELACLLDGKLQLYNRFACSNKEQWAYFPLLVCQQLNINQHEATVLLYGDVGIESEKYHAIHTYFPRVDLGELTDDFKYSKQMADLPQHRYYSLFNMELCG